MQPNPKPSETGQTPAPPPAADVGLAPANADGAAHVSPARALQARLAAELSRSSRPWLWHSTGLVLTAVLALWLAGVMLNAGI